MAKKNIEKSVSRAFEAIVPDSLDKILERCDEQKGELVTMQTKKRKYPVVKWMAVAAAALVLMLGGVVGYNEYNSNYAVASKVVVDVNPSIEILLNSKGNVLKVVANNEDANIIINDKEFLGQTLLEAVDSIVVSLVDNGYLNETANSILVSIEGKKAKKLKVHETVTEEIEKVLQEKEFDASVIVQEVVENKELKDLADEHKVSVGKAELVKKLSEKVEKYNFDELIELSINDLNILAETKENEINISVKGEVSKKGYIEEKQASDITKAAILFEVQFGEDSDEIDADDISDWKCKIDFEDGKMVYDVQFTSKGKHHKFNVDAVLGDILKKGRFDKPEADENKPNVDDNVTSEETETKTDLDATEDGTEVPTTTGNNPGEVDGNEGNAKPEDNKPENNKPEDNKPIKEKLEFNTLTVDEVKAIIFEKLGVTEEGVTSIDVKMNFGFRGLCYEVKVVIGEDEYQYRVNAIIGKVTEVVEGVKPENDKDDDKKPGVDRPEVETKPGTDVKPEDETKPDPENKPEGETKPDPENKPEGETKPGPENKPEDETKPGQNRPNVDENEKDHEVFNHKKIKKLILEKLGITMREIKDIDFDFKYENGTFRVLVKVSMTDGAKVSYLIDAKTGEFITENVEEETEEESKEDKNNGFGGGFRDGRTGNKGR